jgi:predicted chitinase
LLENLRFYKNEENGAGSRLGYILTGIGHSIQGNDWVTKLEAQTIILDNPQGMDINFGDLAVTDDSTGKTGVTITTDPSGKTGKKVGKVGKIDNNVKKNLDEIEKACIKFGLTDPFLIKALKAKIMTETGGIPRNENLNYGTTEVGRLKKWFTSRVASLVVGLSDTTTLQKAGKWPGPVVFGDLIYGNLSGKTGKSFGNTKAGDGYAYRGRSYIGITGKTQYEEYSAILKQDFINNPDDMNTPQNAADSTVIYITKRIPELSNYYSRYFGYAISKTNPVFKSQEDANLFITNCIAGSGNKLTRPGKAGSAFAEILAKVDLYSTQV